MDVYASEEQQVEAIKKWFKENGVSLIVGVALGFGGVFGWRTWLQYQNKQEVLAASGYVKVMNALNQNQVSEARNLGRLVLEKHARTPYAALSALAMAKADLEVDDMAAAKAQLRWVVEHAKLEPLRHIARQRLIRLMLAENLLDETEQLLAESDEYQRGNHHFSVGYNELKGDLLMAQGDVAGAAKYYQSAVSGLPLDSPYRMLLELKRDDTGLSSVAEQP
ncbi:MAG: tetratricopeptide repeat protein [Gammaproteobacteria bacterium]